MPRYKLAAVSDIRVLHFQKDAGREMGKKHFHGNEIDTGHGHVIAV